MVIMGRRTCQRRTGRHTQGQPPRQGTAPGRGHCRVIRGLASTALKGL
jgi:hypothetical protein